MDVEVDDFGCAHGSGDGGCEEFGVDVEYFAGGAHAEGG